MAPTGYPILLSPNSEFPGHIQWSGENPLLSPPECRELIAVGEKKGLRPAAVGNPEDSRVDTNIRKVDAATLLFEDAPWLYERLAVRVKSANDQYYRFDLVGLTEPVQLLRYTAAKTADEKPGHYGWHQDFGAGYMANRKLSVVVQLSQPETYKGCRLRMMSHFEQEVPYVGQGEAVMFPSWTPHHVTPIEEGVRYALAIWVHGPRFR